MSKQRSSGHGGPAADREDEEAAAAMPRTVKRLTVRFRSATVNAINHE
jgi:hypothetical protein